MATGIMRSYHAFALLLFAAFRYNDVVLPCNLSPPHITEQPTSVTIRISLEELRKAATCRSLNKLLSLGMSRLSHSVNIALSSFTRRQDHAALLNAVYVLDRLRFLDLSSIFSKSRVRKATDTLNKELDLSRCGRPTQHWSITLSKLYDIEQLKKDAEGRRYEAVVDMLRILHRSNAQGVFRSLDLACPHLHKMWVYNRFIRLRCSADESISTEWYKNSNPLSPSYRVFPSSARHSTTSYLNIFDLRILDAGWYSCKAIRGCSSTQSENALVKMIIQGNRVLSAIMRKIVTQFCYYMEM